MAAHKHAALMAEYAKDAAETDEPWTRWEHSQVKGEWLEFEGHPAWFWGSQYRRKRQPVEGWIVLMKKPMLDGRIIGILYASEDFAKESGDNNGGVTFVREVTE